MSSEPVCAHTGSIGSLCCGRALEKGPSLSRVPVGSARACPRACCADRTATGQDTSCQSTAPPCCPKYAQGSSVKGEACEDRRNDSYLSCLLGPERQARTEERNGHCFHQELRPSSDMGDTGNLPTAPTERGGGCLS